MNRLYVCTSLQPVPTEVTLALILEPTGFPTTLHQHQAAGCPLWTPYTVINALRDVYGPNWNANDFGTSLEQHFATLVFEAVHATVVRVTLVTGGATIAIRHGPGTVLRTWLMELIEHHCLYEAYRMWRMRTGAEAERGVYPIVHEVAADRVYAGSGVFSSCQSYGRPLTKTMNTPSNAVGTESNPEVCTTVTQSDNNAFEYRGKQFRILDVLTILLPNTEVTLDSVFTETQLYTSRKGLKYARLVGFHGKTVRQVIELLRIAPDSYFQVDRKRLLVTEGLRDDLTRRAGNTKGVYRVREPQLCVM
jgi:hypothetical protein